MRRQDTVHFALRRVQELLLVLALLGLVGMPCNAAGGLRASTGVSMGTTVVALRTKSGLVVGADTRTSSGSMVSNRMAHKLSFLYQSGDDDNSSDGVTCVLCRSGSAADTQYLADEARWEFRSRALWHGMTQPSIGQIARWLRYELVRKQYTASLLCAGYDPREGRGHIFSIAPTGSMVEEDMFAISGSGSTYIVGLVDQTLKGRRSEDLMDEKEAIEFVTCLIHAAMARDGSSGGFARIVVMNCSGCKELAVAPPSSKTSNLDSNNPHVRNQELPGFKSASRPISSGVQSKAST